MALAIGQIDELRNIIPFAVEASANGADFSHDRALMALSMLTSIVGSFAALLLGARARAHFDIGDGHHVWLAASGAMMGAGFWGMHFVGLVALETPLLRGFDTTIALGTLALATLVGATGYLLGGMRLSWWRYPLAGIWFGLGGIGTHYIGMQGLLIDAELAYRPELVLATSIAGIMSSMVSLLVCTLHRPMWMQAIVAFPVGAVIASLHFFDMAGTVMTPHPQFLPPPALTSAPAVAAAGLVLVLALAAFVSAHLDARRAIDPTGSTLFAAKARKTSLRDENEDGVVIVPNLGPLD